APRKIAERAPTTLRSAARAPNETTGALQWEQMFLMIFMARLSHACRAGQPVAEIVPDSLASTQSQRVCVRARTHGRHRDCRHGAVGVVRRAARRSVLLAVRRAHPGARGPHAAPFCGAQ